MVSREDSLTVGQIGARGNGEYYPVVRTDNHHHQYDAQNREDAHSKLDSFLHGKSDRHHLEDCSTLKHFNKVGLCVVERRSVLSLLIHS